MVNPPPDGFGSSEPPAFDLPAPDLPVDVLRALLRDVGVALCVTEIQPDQHPLVWINPAFTALTGHRPEDIIGKDARVLYRFDAPGVVELHTALAEGRSHSARVDAVRADGTPFQDQIYVWPVMNRGVATHGVKMHVDVTAQERERQRLAEISAREAAARADIMLIAQVADLLQDLDDPDLLRQIAALLLRDTVTWVEFFLDNGGGLHTSASLRLDPTAHTRPRFGSSRAGQRQPVHPGGAVLGRGGDVRDGPVARTGPSGDAEPGTVTGRAPHTDLVSELLAGRVHAAEVFDLHASYPAEGASAWLAARIAPRLAAVAPDVGQVVLQPVRGRRHVLGLIAAVPKPEAGSVQHEAALTVLGLVAHRVGMAVDNVRLYEREHRLAETLQRAMLPELADVPGLDVWTYYAPSAEHSQVGGDWYDVLEVASGVAAVVVGDVVGHDVEAAAAMGQLRSVVRAYGAELTAPEVVLKRVDQLVAGMRLSRAASMVYATLTRLDDAWQLGWSRAGHLPVIHVHDGVPTALLDPAGPLVGFARGARTSGHRKLVAGDVLIFYTDGLIERRDRPMREGLEALLEVAAELTAPDAAGMGEDLLARLAEAPEDDVALVVVRIPDGEGDAEPADRGPRQRRWVLASDPGSISRARRLVVKTCRAWGIEDGASAELVVSELVANAVMHGWGHVALQLYDAGGVLRIEVEDANPAPPVSTDGHPGRVGGYGMRIVERLADWGWLPSSEGKVVWAKMRAE